MTMVRGLNVFGTSLLCVLRGDLNMFVLLIIVQDAMLFCFLYCCLLGFGGGGLCCLLIEFSLFSICHQLDILLFV